MEFLIGSFVFFCICSYLEYELNKHMNLKLAFIFAFSGALLITIAVIFLLSK